MSDVKDEIDFEWPGAVTNQVQSVSPPTSGADRRTSSSSATSTTRTRTAGTTTSRATQPPSSTSTRSTGSRTCSSGGSTRRSCAPSTRLTLGRTVRSNSTPSPAFQADTSYFPTTPSRVQISIWPAGIESAAKGTVEWAGGMIDWSNADYVNNGYFWNTIKEISISCTDELPIAPDTTGYQFIGNDSSNVPVRAWHTWLLKRPATADTRWSASPTARRACTRTALAPCRRPARASPSRSPPLSSWPSRRWPGWPNSPSCIPRTPSCMFRVNCDVGQEACCGAPWGAPAPHLASGLASGLSLHRKE